MQPRTLDQILGELAGTYDPQINQIRQRQSLIPQQIVDEEKGLQAKQEQAFGDIVGGARRRGLGFSGIPLGEQAKYTSTEYLPALARLRQSGREQAMGLEDAILGIQERRNTLGQQIYQQEQDRAEQIRQFNAQLAAQREANKSVWPTSGGNTNDQTVASANIQQRADKGFNFTDANGRPISAAQFAAIKGISFRELLQQMANAGDTGAKTALGFVGDDYGYDPRKITSQSLANLYNSLVWGSGKNAQYTAPQPNKLQQAGSSLKQVAKPTMSNATLINRFFNF